MKQEVLNERELVGKILDGDGWAARLLYKLLEKKLERYFTSKVDISEDVQELVQDTFLHILDALPLFRFQSSLTTFAIAIAHHEVLDYWRKRYAKRVIKTIPVLQDTMAVAYSSEMVARAMNEAVEKAYQSLKPIQAQLLRWKYEEGLSIKEIAMLLGWSNKAVEAQLYRARKAFQTAYTEPEIYE